MVDRFWVNDDIKWGKLVKSWATGKNYFDPAKPAPALPRTLGELKAQCDTHGVGVTIPASLKGLAFMQYSADVLAIKLPPKSMVEESEAEFAQGGAYQIPAFYNTFYAQSGSPLNLTTKDQKMDFHAARIGDYSVRNCG
jgi:hypothetical protein